MKPAQMLIGFAFAGFFCVLQKLATLKMAIRCEADSQKAVAIDAGMDQSNLTRKLQGNEPLTLSELDRFPEEVQRAWHLEELSRMGLPARAKRWIKVSEALDGRRKQSA